ncbi:MAG TPA: glycoside hydrolase family 16 protein [Polyangiaceae bacterium]
MLRRVLVLLASVVVAACSSSSGTNGASPDGSSGGGDEGGMSSDASIDTGAAIDASAGADASSTKDAGGGGIADAADESAIPGWTLSWSDEFNGADGSPADPAKWTHDVGGSGWGNQEREYYTDGAQNAVQQGGNLVITATPNGASQYSCWYGTCLYTSARLKTQGLFSQAYGRFEARAQMPFGKGLWPAFWMLGDNIDTVSWPACGEVDILETIGTDISTNHGSLHAPSYNPTGTYSLPNGAKYSDAFHTFAAEWEPGVVRFYVDDVLYETRTSGETDAGGTWEFDHPFFLIVNVAVGGMWPGDPDSTTTFPQTLKVDWIRVYTKNGADY